MSYTLPIRIYTILERVLGKQDAETLAVELESSLKETIQTSKQIVKSELKDELATKKDIDSLESRIKSEILNSKVKVQK